MRHVGRRTDPQDIASQDQIWPTVSVPEVQAGTETGLRAWSPLRVWQAVAAWWSASAMASKLAAIESGATRNRIEKYVSPDQVFVLGGAFTVTPGFTSDGGSAVPPDVIEAFLVCNTAQLGYSVGDVVPYPIYATDSGSSNGLSVVANTNGSVSVRISSGGPVALDKATGTTTYINASYWRIRIICRRFS